MLMGNENAESCIEFLKSTVIYYAGHGVRGSGIMTDNGTGCKNQFHAAC